MVSIRKVKKKNKGKRDSTPNNPDKNKQKNPMDSITTKESNAGANTGTPTTAVGGNTHAGAHPVEKRTDKRPDNQKSWIRFCVICDTDVADKLRMIAQKEGLRIRSLHQGILEAFIDQYEKKHGPLITIKPTKQKVKDLLSSL